MIGFKKPFHSLRIRIMLSAFLIIVLVLPSIGIALNNAFEQQIRINVQSELKAYFYSVLAVTEMDDGELIMPEVLLENQFNVINSGLYALVSQAELSAANSQNNTIHWFSNSFLGIEAPPDLPKPNVGEETFKQVLLNNEAHFIYSYSVRFDAVGASPEYISNPITVHIIKDMRVVIAQQEAFSQQLWTWLLIMIFVLLVIQACWLVWTLKPLLSFTKELDQVQKGKIAQIKEDYPKELQSVATQINALLSNEHLQRQRYRNALTDLAHSLKTPLAATLSQKDLTPSSIEQLQQINRTITYQLKRAQGAGTSAWHLGLPVNKVIDKLSRTMSKIYPSTKIEIKNETQREAVFNGDEADFTEMLGNLLDNACKAAVNKVRLSVFLQDKRIHIVVEDDGQGISESQKSIILERGKRADTYDQGHGIGLAIVRDLIEQYAGTLLVERSQDLGGAKFSISFEQK